MSNIKKLLNIFLISIMLLLTACAETEENMNNGGDSGEANCTPLENIFDLSKNDQYTKITIPDNDGGTPVERGIMEWIVHKITEVITDATEKIYDEIAGDDEFQTILGLMVTLTIMFYALSIMLGINQASGYAALVFFIKIILVFNFAVNWDVFNFYVVEVFEAFVNDTIGFAANNLLHHYEDFEGNTGSGDANLFEEIDKMISAFWDFRVAKVIMALMFTGITGFFWGLMLLMFMLLYLAAVIMAVKTYLFALIARHVLYALGPIFLSFALFNQTKSLFDGYVEQIINFSLQPVFLFIFLGLFHSVLAGFAGEMYLKNLKDPTKLTGATGGTSQGKEPCIVYTNENGITIADQDLYWYKLCYGEGTDFDCPEGSDEKPAIPLDIWVIISAIIVCYLMYSMTSWVVVVATRLSSGYVNISDIPIEGFGKLQGSIASGASNLFKGGK